MSVITAIGGKQSTFIEEVSCIAWPSKLLVVDESEWLKLVLAMGIVMLLMMWMVVLLLMVMPNVLLMYYIGKRCWF